MEERRDQRTFMISFTFFYSYNSHAADKLSDLHDPKSPTWWQSETIYEGIQYPTAVNLTLNLGEKLIRV